jgi:cell division protein ZipA
MPELRWTLLIIGVVFIAVLAWWERRRPHQASRGSRGDGVDSHPRGGNVDAGWGLEPESPGPRALREPTLTLPEIRVREPAGAPQDLPIVEIADDDSLVGLDVAGEPIQARPLPRGKRIGEPEPIRTRSVGEEAVEPGSLDEAIASEPVRAQPMRSAPIRPEEVSELEESGDFEESAELEELEERLERAESVDPLAVPPGRSPELTPIERERPPAAASPPASAGPATTHPESSAAVLTHPESSAAARPEPIVDWPPEDVRRLVALRLVAPQHERFAGRAVRQALSAEGFVLGKFSIFHKPDAQNRAVLSVASLTKPGTFDLETMDTQRFGGLNLFAVLPGPKAPLKAFDELLAAARTLNERLEGALQDDRGGPLTPTRVQVLRDALGAEARS